MCHLGIWYASWYNSSVHPHMDNGTSLSSPSSGLTYYNQEICDSRFSTLGAQGTSATFSPVCSCMGAV